MGGTGNGTGTGSGDAGGRRPGAQDYGWALLAVVAGMLVVFAFLGTTWNLTTEGVSVPVVLGLAFNLTFWSWIGLGAWRRTVWSRPRP